MAANTAPDKDGRSRQVGGMSWVPVGLPASNERGCTRSAVRTTSRSQAAVLAMGSIRRLDDIKEWAQRKGRILNVDALSPDPSGATTARVVPRCKGSP
jgi:hypothetical protein